VGRDEEIGLLWRRWDQVREGLGQVVLVSGEAGIGKSALRARRAPSHRAGGCGTNYVLLFTARRDRRTYQLMVLVAEKPDSDIGMLQMQLRYREGHKAQRVGEYAMTLHQPMEGGHGERQACLNIRPAPMHPLLEA